MHCFILFIRIYYFYYLKSMIHNEFFMHFSRKFIRRYIIERGREKKVSIYLFMNCPQHWGCQITLHTRHTDYCHRGFFFLNITVHVNHNFFLNLMNHATHVKSFFPARLYEDKLFQIFIFQYYVCNFVQFYILD